MVRRDTFCNIPPNLTSIIANAPDEEHRVPANARRRDNTGNLRARATA